MNDNLYKVVEIDINEILPNRFQPRIQFDEVEILELSDSIKEHGVIQPIVVRAIGDKYEIIAGERRYKASVLAGKETVPVIIKNLNDKDSAEIALIENIQRKNLTPIEEALSYKKILDMGYLTQESLANKIGKSQSSVANKIRLLNLSDEVQEALLDNKISERHARSLLRLKSISEQNMLLDKIIDERLTVRKTDEKIDEILNLTNDSEKNIKTEEEKGEENMNNEMNQEINVAKPESMSTFDIFGGTVQSNESNQTEVLPTQPIMTSLPTMEAVVPAAVETPVAPIGGIQFDANGNVITMESPAVAAVPTMEAVVPAAVETPVAPIGGIQFDANGNVITIESPAVAAVPTMEAVVPAAVETPVAPIGGIQFDANGNVITMESPAVAAVPTMEAVVPAAVETPVAPIGGIQFDANGNVITMESPAVAAVPTMEAVVPAAVETPVAPIGGIQFDANGNVITMESPAVAAVPTMEAVVPAAVETPVAPIGGIQFDANGNVITIESPAVAAVPTMEAVVPAAVETPVAPIGGIQFDANGNVITMESPAVAAVPTMEKAQVTEVPVTSPIIESQPTVSTIESVIPTKTESLELSPILEPVTINSSVSVTEPIIITDYNKQYDPVLPNSNTAPQNKIDFKEVINLIRECSNKIEKFGYKIDVEEYDLSTSYQVIFKIEK